MSIFKHASNRRSELFFCAYPRSHLGSVAVCFPRGGGLLLLPPRHRISSLTRSTLHVGYPRFADHWRRDEQCFTTPVVVWLDTLKQLSLMLSL